MDMNLCCIDQSRPFEKAGHLGEGLIRALLIGRYLSS